MDDEFHRRVVVIEDENAIKVRLLGLRLGARNDSGATARARATPLTILHPCRAVAHDIPTDRQGPSLVTTSQVRHVGAHYQILRPSSALTIRPDELRAKIWRNRERAGRKEAIDARAKKPGRQTQPGY